MAQVQLCVVPLSNPDGLTKGYSVTNAAGEVPKFSTHLVCAGEDTPRESRALWDYMDLLRPQIRLEVHAHFTHPGFSRSIGMQEIESMPERVQARAKRIEEAIDSEYHQAGSTTRRVRIDPRVPEEDVYGVREVADAFGVVEIFIQAISDPLKAHNEDVFNCLKTLAGTLIRASAEDLS